MDRPRHLRLVPPPDAVADAPSDAALAALAAAGQVAAWSQLVHRHEHDVLAFAAALADTPAAVDIARDTFVRLWDRRRTFGPETPVRELLLREAYRRADRFRPLDFLRRAPPAPAETPAADAAVPHREDDARAFQRLEATWRLLPRVTRAVLHLDLALGLPPDAVSRLLGVPVARVARLRADGLALLALPGVDDVPRRVAQLPGLRAAALGTSLGDAVLERIHAPRGARHVVASAVALGCAALVTLAAFFMKGPYEDTAWAAMEAMGPLSEAVVPRWHRGDTLLPDTAPVDAGEALTLTLDNRAPEPLHALVVAFDPAGRLHFLAPVDEDPQLDPVSVPVPASRRFDLPALTIPKGIPGDWRFAVLLSRTPRSVRATRAALTLLNRPEPARMQRLLPETTVLVHRLTVR